MQQILDFYWKIEKDKPKQMLKLYNTETKELSFVDLQNYNFNFQLTNERVCVGYYNQGKYIPCIHRTVMDYKNTQCRYCENMEGFKSAFFWDNEPNENMKEYMTSTHEVYMAMFYPDILKVGTAVHTRLWVRTLEQDARFYFKLGNLVGTDVKKLERYVSKTFGITESVRSRGKMKSLTVKIDRERASRELESIFKVIDDHQFPEHLEQALYKSIKVIDNQKHFYFPESFERIRISDLKVLSGDFKGLRGRYLVFNNSNRDYIEDTRYIIGRYVEDYVEEYTYPMPEQQSLL